MAQEKNKVPEQLGLEKGGQALHLGWVGNSGSKAVTTVPGPGSWAQQLEALRPSLALPAHSPSWN